MINRYLFSSSLILILTMCAMTDTVAQMYSAGVISPTGAFDMLSLSFLAGLSVILGIGKLITKKGNYHG